MDIEGKKVVLLNPQFCKHKWDGPAVKLGNDKACVSCSWCGIPYILTVSVPSSEDQLIKACRDFDAKIGYKPFGEKQFLKKAKESSKKVKAPIIRIPSRRELIFERDGYKCLCCGSSKDELSIDHIIPESEGGTKKMDNLQTLCRRCNSDKSNNTIDFRKEKKIKTVIRTNFKFHNIK